MSKSGWCVYTDGSCINGGQRGGYGVVIYFNNKFIDKLYQGFYNTTNNRQELKAVVEALKWFKTPTTLTIFSDSQYVVNSINGKHCFKWIKENRLEKKNLDLWFELVNLLSYHNVTFKWVKGHTDNEKNNYADLLATHAAQCLNIPNDIININNNDNFNKN